MNESVATALPTAVHARRRQERVAWIAGTRGELLLLGPLLRAFKKENPVDAPLHFLFDTGEQGMATQQAMDTLGIRADETASLLHPAEEASVRLQQILERIEAFSRQRKATHLIFTGYNATAVAAALLCHTRAAQGLWLRPADPAGVIERLELESGYQRIIQSATPRVTRFDIDLHPMNETTREQKSLEPVLDEVPGLRGDAGLAMIAVLRREWGMRRDITGLLVRRAADWARRHPELDWLFLSNLNARLESPFRSIKDRPENLLIAPPLPYPVYRGLLKQTRLMLTDSPLFAAEALALSIPLMTLGDLANKETPSGVFGILPQDLEADNLFASVPAESSASHELVQDQAFTMMQDDESIREKISNWIAG